MIGPVVSQLASQSLARSLSGVAGPVGGVAGVLLPVLLPRVASRLGPWGMVAAAVGTFVVARIVERQKARRAAAALADDGTPGRVIEGQVLGREPA